MNCCKCGKKIDYPATYIKMENETDKKLNKILAVCNDCAFADFRYNNAPVEQRRRND